MHRYYAIRISKPIRRKITYIEPDVSEDLVCARREILKRRRSEIAPTRKFSDINTDSGSSLSSKNGFAHKLQKRSLCQISSNWGNTAMRRRSHQFSYATPNEKSANRNYDNVYCAYAEYVIDYLRSCGIQAKLVLQVTAKNGRDDISYVSSDGKFSRFTYHGEAIFYGILRQATWQFGLKDLGLATVANLINYTTAGNNSKDDIAERYVSHVSTAQKLR